ncbi:hypothetical protein ABPG72_000870 [Tetrahymena utriculariae]
MFCFNKIDNKINKASQNNLANSQQQYYSLYPTDIKEYSIQNKIDLQDFFSFNVLIKRSNGTITAYINITGRLKYSTQGLWKFSSKHSIVKSKSKYFYFPNTTQFKDLVSKVIAIGKKYKYIKIMTVLLYFKNYFSTKIPKIIKQKMILNGNQNDHKTQCNQRGFRFAYYEKRQFIDLLTTFIEFPVTQKGNQLE